MYGLSHKNTPFLVYRNFCLAIARLFANSSKLMIAPEGKKTVIANGDEKIFILPRLLPLSAMTSWPGRFLPKIRKIKPLTAKSRLAQPWLELAKHRANNRQSGIGRVKP
jgi:hypothetical protein